MERIITDPSGLKVQQQLVALTDIAGNVVDPSSGGGGKLSDTILTDDSGTQFLARDNGTTLTYITLAGAPYTPSTNIRAVVVAGGATSALQTTGNTSLASINTALAKGQSNAAGSLSVVLSSDGPFATNFGITTDTHTTWYDTTSSFMSRVALMIAALVDAGSHAYGYNGSNQLVTDAWTLFGTTRTKTYTYTSGNLTAETDWV